MKTNSKVSPLRGSSAPEGGWDVYEDAPRANDAEISLSPRKKGKLATRRKIMAAARKLFAERGYSATGAKDIVLEAGVGYGSFYEHFETKLECYLALIQEVAYESAKAVQWFCPTRDDPAKFIPVMVRTLFDYSLINPGLMQAKHADVGILFVGDEKRAAGGTEMMVDQLEAWKKTGHIDADMDTTTVSYLIASALRMGDKLVLQNPERLDEIVKTTTDFILSGLKPNRN